MRTRPLIFLLMISLFSAHADAQVANEECKFLGNILAGVAHPDFKNYWNQVSPENGGKWGSAERTRDVMSWNDLDLAYDYAQENGLPFKQHTLVWGQQQPEWMSSLSAEEQLEEVDEWIKSFCTRYPETDFIDVVNEPLHAVPAYASALGGGGATGWDWVIWAFEKAREYCPDAKLVMNDYNIINNDAATDNYITIIELLQDRELIDIVGEQGHFMETTPSATIKRNLDKLYGTGLPIHISEYDVNLADDQQQLQKYREQFPVLWSHPGVHGVTLWGYKQGQIWRENAYLIRTNGTVRPALTWLQGYVDTNSGCDPVTGMLGESSRLDFYPTPVRDGKLMLDPGAGNFNVRILNTQGYVRKELNVPANRPVAIQLEEPAGLYLLEVNDGRKTTYRKIVLN